MYTHSSQKAFTIVEVVIVIVITIVVLTIASNAYTVMLNNQRMNSAIEGAVTLIQKARTNSISSKNTSGTTGKGYGIQFNAYNGAFPNQIRLIDEYGTLVESFTVSDSVEVYIVAIAPSPDNSGEIFFRRISGDVFVKQGGASVNLVSGDITLRLKTTGALKTINISPVGVLNIS